MKLKCLTWCFALFGVVFFILIFYASKISPNQPSLLENIFLTFSSCFISLFISVFVIQGLLDKRNENQAKEKERALILRHQKVYDRLFSKYILTLHWCTNPLNDLIHSKIPVESITYFPIKKLQFIYSPTGLIYAPMGEYAVTAWFNAESELRDFIVKEICSIDFKYYPVIGNLFIDFVNISITNDVKETILQYKRNGIYDKLKEVIEEALLDESRNLLKERDEGKLRGTIFLPFANLYALMLGQLQVIGKIHTEIEKLKKE